MKITKNVTLRKKIIFLIWTSQDLVNQIKKRKSPESQTLSFTKYVYIVLYMYIICWLVVFVKSLSLYDITWVHLHLNIILWKLQHCACAVSSSLTIKHNWSTTFIIISIYLYICIYFLFVLYCRKWKQRLNNDVFWNVNLIANFRVWIQTAVVLSLVLPVSFKLGINAM